jgi:hypothetical protein
MSTATTGKTVLVTTILISPSRNGWLVRMEGESEPLSEHQDANDATRAAERFAREHEGTEVFLVDRYHRLRPLTTRPRRPTTFG